MASLNRINIIGNLGRDPEIKYTQSNVGVANFSVATTESWKDKATGEWQEKTEWHRVVAWDRLAEQAAKLVKGSQVYVEGRLETRKYTGKDNTEKSVTEIRADRILPLGPKQAAPAAGGDNGDDLPF